MKIFKRILIGLLALIALLLIVAALTQKSYTIQRSVVINRPVSTVYEYMRYQKNQIEYNSWYRMDPATQTEVRGIDGEVGALWAWNSQVTGQGEQKTVSMVPNKQIDFEITFIKPMAGKAQNSVVFEALDSNTTKINSTFHGDMPYPLNLMLLFMDMDKMIGTELQNGLNNMRDIINK